MNHYKTLFFSFLLSLFLGAGHSLAKLQRELKPSEIKTLKNNILKNPSNIKSRLFLADHYFEKKQWSQVIKTLSPVVEELPDHALYQISKSYLKSSNFRASESIINILLSRKDVTTANRLLAIELYSSMISVLERTGKSTEWVNKTFDLLKVTKQQDPQNREVYDTWLEQLEKHIPHFAPEALRVMEDMIANKVTLQPKDYSSLCKYNHLSGYTKATKITCQQAIIREPLNPSNLIYLGQTHIQTGEEKKGKRMLASVGQKFSQSEEALWATANSYYQSKNISAAYSFYKKATLHKEAKPRDFLGLAKSAFELKKYGVALSAFVEHCRRTRILDHEFRRASGLLKKHPRWQSRYRQKMMDCKPKKKR